MDEITELEQEIAEKEKEYLELVSLAASFVKEKHVTYEQLENELRRATA